MPLKDHLTSKHENDRNRDRTVKKMSSVVYQASPPIITNDLSSTGIEVKTPDEVENTALPILYDIDSKAKNILDSVDIDLALKEAHCHVVQLSDNLGTITDVAVNFINLVKNKGVPFFLEFIKDPLNIATPSVTFDPPLEGLPAGFPDLDPRYLFQVLAMDTPDETRYEVVNQGGGGGGGASPLTTKGDLFGYSTNDARLPISGNDGYVLTEDSTASLGVAWKPLPAGGTNTVVVKQNDEIRTFEDTLTADDDLAVTGLAAGAYSFDLMFFVSGHPTPDFKWSFGSTGATLTGSKIDASWESPTNVLFEDITVTEPVFMAVGVTQMFIVRGYFELDSAGSFEFRWAPASSQAEDTTVHKGSTLTVKSTGSSGGGGGGGDNLGNHTADFDLNMSTFDITALDRLLFEKAAGNTLISTQVGITSNANGDIIQNASTDGNYFWTVNNVEIATLQVVATNPLLQVKGTDDGTPIIRVFREDSTPTLGATVGYVEFWGVDAGGISPEQFGRIKVDSEDLTPGGVDGSLHLQAEKNSFPSTFLSLNHLNDDKISIWKNLEVQAGVDIELNGNDIWFDAGQSTKLDGTATGIGVTVNNALVAVFNEPALVLQPDVDFTTRGVLLTPTTNTFLTDGQIWYDSAASKFKGRQNGATVDLIGAGGGGGATTELDNLTVTALNADVNMSKAFKVTFDDDKDTYIRGHSTTDDILQIFVGGLERVRFDNTDMELQGGYNFHLNGNNLIFGTGSGEFMDHGGASDIRVFIASSLRATWGPSGLVMASGYRLTMDDEIRFTGITKPGSNNESKIYAENLTNDQLVLNVENNGEVRFDENGVEFARFGGGETQIGTPTGYNFNFLRNDLSPNDDDLIVSIFYQGNNSLGGPLNYAKTEVFTTDVSSGTEDATWKTTVVDGGELLTAISLNNNTFQVESESRTDLVMLRNESTPTTGTIAEYRAETQNSIGSIQDFFALSVQADNITNNAEESDVTFSAFNAGVTKDFLRYVQGGLTILQDVNEKLGFFGATPVVRQQLDANPSNSEISTLLRNYGLSEL